MRNIRFVSSHFSHLNNNSDVSLVMCVFTKPITNGLFIEPVEMNSIVKSLECSLFIFVTGLSHTGSTVCKDSHRWVQTGSNSRYAESSARWQLQVSSGLVPLFLRVRLEQIYLHYSFQNEDIVLIRCCLINTMLLVSAQLESSAALIRNVLFYYLFWTIF